MAGASDDDLPDDSDEGFSDTSETSPLPGPEGFEPDDDLDSFFLAEAGEGGNSADEEVGDSHHGRHGAGASPTANGAGAAQEDEQPDNCFELPKPAGPGWAAKQVRPGTPFCTPLFIIVKANTIYLLTLRFQAWLVSRKVVLCWIEPISNCCSSKCMAGLFRNQNAESEQAKVDVVINHRKQALRAGPKAGKKGGYHHYVQNIHDTRATASGSNAGPEKPGGGKKYLLAATLVCATAVRSFFAISESTWQLWRSRHHERGGARLIRSTQPHGDDATVAEEIAAWFEESVVAYGEVQPTNGNIIVPKYRMRDLYDQYVLHHVDVLPYTRVPSLAYFGTIIKGRFPKVKQRKHRGIASKCSTCDVVQAGIDFAIGTQQDDMARRLRLVKRKHKVEFYGKERFIYIKRRRRAFEQHTQVIF